ncbi:MAG TPA: hypothetical protein VLQ48_02560 [Chloroflexia bacterium]|nr:hypothetical protein [Chloroflexia bacterium]
MNKIFTPRVLTSLGVTGFAAIIAAAIWNRPSDVQFLMLALLTMTALGAVTNPHWLVSLGALCGALVLYGAVWVMGGSGGITMPEGLLGICLLVATALGAWSLSRGLRGTERRLVQQAQLIDDLTLYDQQTGAVRASHIQQLLNYEIIRARRYNEPLTVAVIQMANEQARKTQGNTGTEKELRRKVTELLLNKLRAVDRVGYSPSVEWVLLLPNTPRMGGETLAVRLIHLIAEQLRANVIIGQATFPEDGSDSDSLMEEARAAIEFGRMNGMSMVSQALFDNP